MGDASLTYLGLYFLPEGNSLVLGMMKQYGVAGALIIKSLSVAAIYCIFRYFCLYGSADYARLYEPLFGFLLLYVNANVIFLWSLWAFVLCLASLPWIVAALSFSIGLVPVLFRRELGVGVWLLTSSAVVGLSLLLSLHIAFSPVLGGQEIEGDGIDLYHLKRELGLVPDVRAGRQA